MSSAAQRCGTGCLQRHLPTLAATCRTVHEQVADRLEALDLDAKFVRAFLDHLERDRKNGARSRNARLAVLHAFLKYAARYDLSALGVIERALAVPLKRFDRPMLGFLTRQEAQAILDAPNMATWAGQHDQVLFKMNIDLRAKNLILVASPTVHLTGKDRKQRNMRCGARPSP